MMITNENGLPESIVEAVRNDEYDPGESDISVTTLIAPPQIRVLRGEHSEGMSEDASDRIYALLGQAVHTILERAEPSAVVEERLYMMVRGWKVGGKFDRLKVVAGLLQDYKVASVWEYIFGLKPERIAQLNVLAELCRRNGYEINKLEVVMIFRDWKKSEAKFKPENEYPKHQAAVIEVPMWSEAQCMQYIEDCVIDHQLADAGEIRECSEEERWAKPDKWAVMKKGRKSALRVLDSSEDAEEWKDQNGGDEIVHRPGVSTRCEDYCPVADFCHQFKRLKEAS